MSGFEAVLIRRDESGAQRVERTTVSEADLPPGDVVVRVEATGVNYKDGLAVTGKAPVVRRFPMVPGIDFAGTVLSSESPEWKPGDRVILNGWGLGETRWGAWGQRARVESKWLVPLPETMTAVEAMAVGTAGYTAMLALMALERHGLTPERGPIVVTGAAGGVGSVAVALFAARGFSVVASTGRMEEADYLRELGAAEVIGRDELAGAPKPLNKERWAGGVDAVGSTTLANLLSMTSYGGAVAACGLAGGMDLPGSVAPFILRGVSLLGIDSVMAPPALRREAWTRLAGELSRDKLRAMTTEVPFEGLLDAARAIVEGRVRGRVVAALG